MKEVTLGKIKSLQVPAGASNLTITHELGDIVVSNASVSNTYSLLLDSLGVHTLKWFSGSNTIQVDHYLGVTPYLTLSEFFEDFDELSLKDDQFVKTERRIRHIIESYTQQKFGPMINKTITVQGTGGNSLSLPYKILKLSSIVDSFGNNPSSLVEIDPECPWFLTRTTVNYGYTEARLNGSLYDTDVKTDITRDNRSTFKSEVDYTMVGDFGWYWVPADVSEAAKILIADSLNANNEFRQHRIKQAQLGDFSYTLADVDGSTGNTDADMLLAPFVMINIGLA